MQKIDPHIFSGLQQDLDPHKMASEFLVEARNIRISGKNNATNMAITPEFGTTALPIVIYNVEEIEGTYIGHYKIGDYLILFTHYSKKDGELRDLNGELILKHATLESLGFKISDDNTYVYKDSERYDIEEYAKDVVDTFKIIDTDGSIKWYMTSKHEGEDDSHLLYTSSFEKVRIPKLDSQGHQMKDKDGYPAYVAEVGEIEGIDRIYRFRKSVSQGQDVYKVDLLIQKDLGLSADYPLSIQGTVKSNVEYRLYWTDGKNPLRTINILEDMKLRGGVFWDTATSLFLLRVREFIYKESDTSRNDILDVQQKMSLEEVGKVYPSNLGGEFPAGALQYCATYISNAGKETNIFWTSPIIYCGKEQRACSPEEISNITYNIKLFNLDTSYRYIVLYALHRTSLDGPVTARKVTTIDVLENLLEASYDPNASVLKVPNPQVIIDVKPEYAQSLDMPTSTYLDYNSASALRTLVYLGSSQPNWPLEENYNFYRIELGYIDGKSNFHPIIDNIRLRYEEGGILKEQVISNFDKKTEDGEAKHYFYLTENPIDGYNVAFLRNSTDSKNIELGTISSRDIYYDKLAVVALPKEDVNPAVFFKIDSDSQYVDLDTFMVENSIERVGSSELLRHQNFPFIPIESTYSFYKIPRRNFPNLVIKYYNINESSKLEIVEATWREVKPGISVDDEYLYVSSGTNEIVSETIDGYNKPSRVIVYRSELDATGFVDNQIPLNIISRTEYVDPYTTNTFYTYSYPLCTTPNLTDYIIVNQGNTYQLNTEGFVNDTDLLEPVSIITGTKVESFQGAYQLFLNPKDIASQSKAYSRSPKFLFSNQFPKEYSAGIITPIANSPTLRNTEGYLPNAFQFFKSTAPFSSSEVNPLAPENFCIVSFKDSRVDVITLDTKIKPEEESLYKNRRGLLGISSYKTSKVGFPIAYPNTDNPFGEDSGNEDTIAPGIYYSGRNIVLSGGSEGGGISRFEPRYVLEYSTMDVDSGTGMEVLKKNPFPVAHQKSKHLTDILSDTSGGYKMYIMREGQEDLQISDLFSLTEEEKESGKCGAVLTLSTAFYKDDTLARWIPSLNGERVGFKVTRVTETGEEVLVESIMQSPGPTASAQSIYIMDCRKEGIKKTFNYNHYEGRWLYALSELTPLHALDYTLNVIKYNYPLDKVHGGSSSMVTGKILGYGEGNILQPRLKVTSYYYKDYLKDPNIIIPKVSAPSATSLSNLKAARWANRAAIKSTPTSKNFISIFDSGIVGEEVNINDVLTIKKQIIGGKDLEIFRDSLIVLGAYSHYPKLRRERYYDIKAQAKKLTAEYSKAWSWGRANLIYTTGEGDIVGSATFKQGNTYRLGFQLQNDFGLWTEPYFLDDYTLKYETSEGKMNIRLDLDLNTLDGLPYKCIRPLVCFASPSERKIIEQGLLSPTIFEESLRDRNAPYAQSSWFFRDFAENRKQIFGEIQGERISEGITNTSGTMRYFVDTQIVTLHNSFLQDIIVPTDAILDNVKTAVVSGINGEFAGQTSSPPLSTDARGFSEYKSGVEGFKIANYMYHDVIVNCWGNEDSSNVGALDNPVINKEVNYLVYPWHRNGSLNNDCIRGDKLGTRSAVLKKKTIANYNYFVEKTPASQYNKLNIINTSSWRDKGDVVRIYENYGRTLNKLYYGEVNTIALSEDKYPIYFRAVPKDSLSRDFWKFTFPFYSNHRYLLAAWTAKVTGMSPYVSTGYERGININDTYLPGLRTTLEGVPIKYKSSPHLILNLEYPIEIDASALIADIALTSNPTFGGSTEAALQANVWYIAGDSTKIITGYEGEDKKNPKKTTLIWKYGDAFTEEQEFLKTYAYDDNAVNSIVEIGRVKLTSFKNASGRYDNNRFGNNKLYVSPTNFNLFNDVYSQLNNLFNYQKLAFIEDEDSLHDNQTIMWSSDTTTSIYNDNLQDFPPANETPIDIKYGKGEAIVSANDLLLFQTMGISKLQYKESTIINSDSVSPITLTSTNPNSITQYIVLKNTGIGNYKYLNNTSENFYYIDLLSKHLMCITSGGQPVDISLKNNMAKWFKDNYDNIIGVNYDNYSKDVIIMTKDESLIYSEILGQFVGIFDYKGLKAIVSEGDYELAIVQTDSKELNANPKDIVPSKNKYIKFWKMHSSDKICHFFGHYYPYKMAFYSNLDVTKSKYFTNLNIRADWRNLDNLADGSGVSNSLFFDTIRVSNEYQDSGIVPIKTSRAEQSAIRKFRIWRMNLPRALRRTRDFSTYNKPSDWEDYSPASSSYWQQSYARFKRDRFYNPWIKIELSKNVSEDEHTPGIIHDLDVTYYD